MYSFVAFMAGFFILYYAIWKLSLFVVSRFMVLIRVTSFSKLPLYYKATEESYDFIVENHGMKISHARFIESLRVFEDEALPVMRSLVKKDVLLILKWFWLLKYIYLLPALIFIPVLHFYIAGAVTGIFVCFSYRYIVGRLKLVYIDLTCIEISRQACLFKYKLDPFTDEP